MNLDSTHAVNEPDVIAESVAGETLIINLKTGIYYSAAGVGDEIWRSLQGGHSVGQVVEAICGRYSGDADAIRTKVLGFISQLRSEDLIVESEAPATTADAPARRNGDAPAFDQP